MQGNPYAPGSTTTASYGHALATQYPPANQESAPMVQALRATGLNSVPSGREAKGRLKAGPGGFGGARQASTRRSKRQQKKQEAAANQQSDASMTEQAARSGDTGMPAATSAGATAGRKRARSRSRARSLGSASAAPTAPDALSKPSESADVPGALASGVAPSNKKRRTGAGTRAGGGSSAKTVGSSASAAQDDDVEDEV